MKKGNKVFKVIGIIFLISVIFIVSVYGYISFKIKSVKKVKIPKNNSELSIDKNTQEKSKLNDIKNIAFFGIDTRENSGVGRSDCIMVISIDGKHDKIKLSSIMRDTYVPIEGHGKTKLNHAYAYGGPQLAIKTINKNFGLDIKDFVTVNFFELADIIDTLGGVNISIEQDEIKHIHSSEISTPGVYNLTGAQAVDYCRIRHAAGGDYKRTDRQREVLVALINKVFKMSNKQILEITPKLASKVRTNMSTGDIIKLASEVLTSNIRNVEQKRFPLDGNAKGQLINNVWYLITNVETTKKDINEFIFQE